MTLLKEIEIQSIPGFSIGQAEIPESATGVTVILAKDGAVTGVDIRGGGPASRESGLLNPLAANDGVHAVILSGGSAFGLSTADGVMRYLEERNIGFAIGDGVVPIVCASCIYDLGLVTSKVRPDAHLAYKACTAAPNFQEGNHGCGTGATVGKANGPKYMMKAGIGSYALQLGDFQIGAIVAVNAMGDIYNPSNGEKIAGMLSEHMTLDASCEDALYTNLYPQVLHGNTTIGAILTNGKFSKTQCTKIAGMAHDGFARAINPVHTMFDGDSIYTMSHGDVEIDINIAGSLAARVMAQAIVNACTHTDGMYGLKSAKDFL